MPEITKEIIESFAILSMNSKSWTKEFNLVSWNGREARFDIREWSPDKSRSGKGITLSSEELVMLADAVSHIDIEKYQMVKQA